jgi:hypothetical protein
LKGISLLITTTSITKVMDTIIMKVMDMTTTKETDILTKNTKALE